MAHEQVRKPQSLLQILQLIDDLRLYRHIQRRYGLVAHYELGIGGKRARNAYALALTARKLMRISRDVVGLEANRIYQLVHALHTLGIV